MQVPRTRVLLAPLASFALVAAVLSALRESAPARAGRPSEPVSEEARDDSLGVPDAFNPDVDPAAPPAEKALGGRIILHLESMPSSLNRVIENSSVLRGMYYAINDSLLAQDWWSFEMTPRLARGWEVEDQLILRDEAAGKFGDAVLGVGGENARRMLHGTVSEAGGRYTVTPGSTAPRLAEPVRVEAGDVASLERGTVFTFHLRDDVTWHDGHPFDAWDVYFTWEAWQNPGVDCDEVRSLFGKLIHAEVIDDHTVRFVFRSQYYGALETIGEMPIMPRHLFDLRDPDCRDHDPNATDEARARYVNVNPANDRWVGTGAYRVTEANPQYIEAERYDGYFAHDDPEIGGYLDAIRWRYIADDNTAFQAILNGELDLLARMAGSDYFGAATESTAFKESFYKGYVYTAHYGYVGWNLRRPFFREVQVRRALAHAFDVPEFLNSFYRGLGRWITGPPNSNSPAYDRTIEGPAYDPDLAEELLAEAGWYDRDGNGIIDKDGVDFEFTFLFPTGNESSKAIGLKFQESLAGLGIKMNLANMEWATFLDAAMNRDFDAVNLSWQPDIESDPEQVWHSKWAPENLRSSNFVSYADPRTDELIAEIQRELDTGKRMQLWHELHARVASLQPYCFLVCPPRKFAMSKRFRGFRTSAIAPGYDIRQVYLPAGAAGTRRIPDSN